MTFNGNSGLNSQQGLEIAKPGQHKARYIQCHPPRRSAWVLIGSLKCPYRQNFYFPIRSYISCILSKSKKFFDLDKERFFYESFKT